MPDRGYALGMQLIPYIIVGGVAAISLGIALILGGEMWAVPAIVIPAALLYFVYDRRRKAAEGFDERAGAAPTADVRRAPRAT